MRGKVIYKNGRRICVLEDKEVSEAQYDRAFPSKLHEILEMAGKGRGTRRQLLAGHQPSCWPMRSEALAVHPDQVQEATEQLKRHGISGVRYEGDGTAVLQDRGARRELLRLEGMVDRQGGYGD